MARFAPSGERCVEARAERRGELSAAAETRAPGPGKTSGEERADKAADDELSVAAEIHHAARSGIAATSVMPTSGVAQFRVSGRLPSDSEPSTISA